MKKIKLSLFTLISVAGIGGAFATTYKAPNKKRFAYTYYAIANGNAATHFSWTTTLPPLTICATSGLPASYCTITTNQSTKPAPGQFPTQPYNHSMSGSLNQ